MPTYQARKLALASVLIAFSAPALASDAADTTAQQTAVGHTTEMAASTQGAPLVVNETYATATAAPSTAPRARAKVAEPRPVRQYYSGGEYRAAPPLILGIRH